MFRFSKTPRPGARRRRLSVQALERRQVFAAGIDVTPTTNLVTTEDGGAVALEVRLTEAPQADVTVNVFLGDPTEADASPGALSFTPQNWDVAQTLTVTGKDDLLEDGAVPYSIGLTAESTDPNYAVAPPRFLSFVNQDNESDHPPRVLAVAIDGAANFSPEYLVPGGSGEQLRTVAVGGVDVVRIYFDQPVNLSSSNLVVAGVRTPLHTITGFSYDPATYSAQWKLSDIIHADRLTLTLADVITDQTGFTLDGEWDGPTSLTDPSSSEFPSGNGAQGGAFVFNVTVLSGDGTRDNRVTGADFTVWANHFFEPPGSVTFVEGDYNGDGRATGADFTLWANTFGVTFPPLAIEAGGSGLGSRGIALDGPATRLSTQLAAPVATPRRESSAAPLPKRARVEIRSGLEEFS